MINFYYLSLLLNNTFNNNKELDKQLYPKN